MGMQRFESLRVESLMEILTQTAKQVPDDKLDWKPDTNGKSSSEIVHHLIGANHAFAAMIRGQDVPTGNKQDFSIQPGSMDDAFGELHKSGLHLSEAIAEVSDEQLRESKQMPWGETWTMTRLVSAPSAHIAYHWGQLAYLQTLWGDQKDHY